ncbi:unnamed protein product, partial [Amoebophrya sp. A120]
HRRSSSSLQVKVDQKLSCYSLVFLRLRGATGINYLALCPRAVLDLALLVLHRGRDLKEKSQRASSQNSIRGRVVVVKMV